MQPQPGQQYYYSNQQPPQYAPQPPSQPPKKKPKIGLFIGLIVVFVALFACFSAVAAQRKNDAPNYYAATASSNVVTTVATTAPQSWTTTQQLSGNGEKKTSTFAAPDDWKLKWTCDPSSFMGGTYNVSVSVMGSDNSIQDLAVNTICKAGNVSGETEEHQGGQVYLDINSEAAWTITIQELK